MSAQTSIKIPPSLREMGDCFNCIARLKDDIARLKGVVRVEDTSDASSVLVEFDPAITTTEVIESYIARQGQRIKSHYGHEHYVLEGIDCPDCALKLEQSLSKIPGVTWVSLNFATSNIWFEYEPEEVTRERILSTISRAGYHFREAEVATVAFTTIQSSFALKGLDCPDCSAKLKERISRLEGVHEVKVNFANASMLVRHETGKTSRADIIATVEEAGYQASFSSADQAGGQPAGLFAIRNRKVLSTLCSGCFILLAWAANFFTLRIPLPFLTIAGYDISIAHLFCLAAVVGGGYYAARNGYYSLLAKTFDMNFLMTAAVIGALGIGEFEEGAMVVFLFSLGNTLQSYTMDRARNALRSLMDLAPTEAHLKKGGRLITVPAAELKIGDLIVVKPGEKISIDGTVIQGSSFVNEAPITGESNPVDKGQAARVFAGSINGPGSLEVRVDRLASDSTLSRIIHLVEEAQAQKAPSQTFVDAFSKIYTPIVIVAAAAVSIIPPLVLALPFTDWFYRGLMLLIISCPCALVISTPVAIVSAIACASRKGILIKGGAYLEEMGSISAIAFDKTGTLTCGRFEVTDIIDINGTGSANLLATAASLEMKSDHPLARAIVKRALQDGIALREPRDLTTFPGMGARATLDGRPASIGNRSLLCEQGINVTPYDGGLERLENEGKTAVLIHHHATQGIIALADTLRQGADTCIDRLRRIGIRHVVMLTGDNERVSSAIARQLKIDGFQAALLPEEKVDAVRELLFKYKKVAMVGDGVNDAPALAVSSVGIAMGAAGTDAALEAADIALMADDLFKLPFLVHLSRKTLAAIKTNIAFSLIVKAVFIMTVFLGWSNLWMAVAADMGTSLLVTLNGMRLIATRWNAAPASQPVGCSTATHTLPSCSCSNNH